LLLGLVLLVGCAEEVPPPSVQDYLDDPNALEAAVVRCAANRAETRYDAECVNARQAVSIIEAKEERERRAAFEAESDKKRQALRRTQQAAAEARRRAEELERQRREADYLAQFGELPPSEDADSGAENDTPNAPGAVYEPAESGVLNQPYDDAPAVDGGNAPTVDETSAPVPEGDLDAVREELRRRAEESEGQ
jgi:hypothetical protein